MKLTRLNKSGFTIVEVIMAVTVAGIMAGVLLSVTFRYYVNAAQSQVTADLALESQTLLSQIVEDLRLAVGVGATNQLPDPNAPGSGWATSDTNNVLIVRSPAVTQDRDIIYEPATGFPYENEFVFFLQNKVMYKRVIKNTSAAGNAATSTCPAALATSTCPDDRIFSENVTNISFTFYDTNNAVTTDPQLARSVKITLDMSKKSYGKTINLSNTTQVTQRNL